MINWEFDPNKVDDVSFEPLPIGDYRVRIEDIEECEGNKFPYLKITLKVSGDRRKLWHNLVFMSGTNDKGTDLARITNTNLGRIYDSFGIEPGNMDFMTWIGKVGACRVKHEIYNGQTQSRVAYFIDRDKQDKLPAWSEDVPVSIDDDFTLLEEDDEIPF